MWWGEVFDEVVLNNVSLLLTHTHSNKYVVGGPADGQGRHDSGAVTNGLGVWVIAEVW